MDTISRSWTLFKQSLAVLSADTEILLFPVMSAVASILVAITFLVPLYQDGTLLAAAQGTAGSLDYLVLFAWYYCNYFVIIFFNSALVGCANIRFSGGDPSLVDGLSIAARHIHRIAAWALVAATVGILLSLSAVAAASCGSSVPPWQSDGP